MAQPVKSITPDALIQPFIRSRIYIRGRLEGRVKGSIEHRYLSDSLAENPPRGIDCLQFEFIVRWGNFRFEPNRVPNFGSNPHRLPQLPSMHDPMRDSIDGSGRGTQHGFEILMRLNMGLPERHHWLRRSMVKFVEPAFHAAGAAINRKDSHIPSLIAAPKYRQIARCKFCGRSACSASPASSAS